MHKYPVGIQSFEKIRKQGFLYIDKTPLIYKMITEGCPYFLSRPRRFGKSLLVSTLEAVFQGRRELFEAFTTEDGIEQPQLYIATTNWRWEQYPVLRFDFSKDLISVSQLDVLIDDMLAGYERKYGITSEKSDSFIRMRNLIETAHAKTGRRVVVLVDEYDKHMLHSIGKPEDEEYVRNSFKSLFSPLKEMDDHLQFVFITGISKFSQMGVFSTINQLNNISMQPAYDTLCGISEEELLTQLRPDIEQMACCLSQSYDETLTALKQNYDGYHFSEQMTDIYNPFSLFNAFDSGQLKDYWFASATSSALIDMLAQMPPLQLSDIDGVECASSAFDRAFTSYKAPLPVLYQSGYLTIKHYDRELDAYTLGLPNGEVRRGFADCLYQYVMHKQDEDDLPKNAFQMAYKRFRRDNDLPTFIQAIKTFFAGIPYHLEQDNRNEHYYHAILYTLLTAFGADVRAEEPSAKGRADITLLMPRTIYVIELKYDDTAAAALDQLRQRGYADKYALDGRPKTLVGIAFSSTERNITDWQTE